MEGEELRRIRRRLGHTQEQLAKLVGVHKITVSRWERNESRIPAATASSLRVFARVSKGDIPEATRQIIARAFQLGRKSERLANRGWAKR
jgi:transcriptional regulator with XRE-family HTH domain